MAKQQRLWSIPTIPKDGKDFFQYVKGFQSKEKAYNETKGYGTKMCKHKITSFQRNC